MKNNTNQNTKDKKSLDPQNKNSGLEFDDSSPFLKEFFTLTLTDYIIISLFLYLFLDIKIDLDIKIRNGIITNKGLIEDIDENLMIFSSNPTDSGDWAALQKSINEFNYFLQEKISEGNLIQVNAELLNTNDLIVSQLKTLFNRIKDEKFNLKGTEEEVELQYEKIQKDLPLDPYTPTPAENTTFHSKKLLDFIIRRQRDRKNEILRIIRKAENVFKELEKIEEIHKDKIEEFEKVEEEINEREIEGLGKLPDNSRKSFNTLPSPHEYSTNSRIVQADGKEYIAVPRNTNPALHTLNLLHDESSMTYEPLENPIFEKVAYDYFPIDEYNQNNHFSL